MNPHFLSAADFATVIRSTPLVSIDLILTRPDQTILVGRRQNEPAKGCWFVPGGRIRKDERLDAAFHRLLKTETGLDGDRAAARLLGFYEHLYDTNALGDASFGTHYVVLGYRLDVPADAAITADTQHAEFQWRRPEDLLSDPDVHANTKAYFPI
jgi:colanic acid biosynthesis protein WcaH